MSLSDGAIDIIDIWIGTPTTDWECKDIQAPQLAKSKYKQIYFKPDEDRAGSLAAKRKAGPGCNQKKCCLMESARINTTHIRKQHGTAWLLAAPAAPASADDWDGSERAVRGDGWERDGEAGGRKKREIGREEKFVLLQFVAVKSSCCLQRWFNGCFLWTGMAVKRLMKSNRKVRGRRGSTAGCSRTDQGRRAFSLTNDSDSSRPGQTEKSCHKSYCITIQMNKQKKK